MTDKISFLSNDELAKNIKIIIAQTNYTEDQAIEKLKLFNNDYMRVLRDYMGIAEKKEPKIKSVNQEIFRQIRTKLDTSMKEYRDKHPIDMEQVITNIQESEEREKTKQDIK
jgi:hypothetical protein